MNLVHKAKLTMPVFDLRGVSVGRNKFEIEIDLRADTYVGGQSETRPEDNWVLEILDNREFSHQARASFFSASPATVCDKWHVLTTNSRWGLLELSFQSSWGLMNDLIITTNSIAVISWNLEKRQNKFQVSSDFQWTSSFKFHVGFQISRTQNPTTI